jgi:hypothetical protein
MKAQQWGRAKGELRALVDMQGTHASTSPSYITARWQELEARVEAFIKAVELDELEL